MDTSSSQRAASFGAPPGRPSGELGKTATPQGNGGHSSTSAPSTPTRGRNGVTGRTNGTTRPPVNPPRATRSGTAPLHRSSSDSMNLDRFTTDASAGGGTLVDPRVTKAAAAADLDDCLGDGETQLLNGLFSTRRPRDIRAGLSSGFKSVVKGVGFGAVTLVAAPTVGAFKHGIGGFFKGLLAGVLGAVIFPVTGVGVGVTQVARGALHTPEAVQQKRAGRKWDKKNRVWKEDWYSLDDEYEDVQTRKEKMENLKKAIASSAEKATKQEARNRGVVVDTTYYDILEVEPSAPQAEIKRSYFRLAKMCHPDMNPDDPEANRKFQALGEAYQVLGDPERRLDYDLNGKAASSDMEFIDPGLFFTILFGSEQMEPFVGKLKMAMLMESFEGSENLPSKTTEKVIEYEQQRREVDLARLLRERVEPYVGSDEVARRTWKKSMHELAAKLCTNMFGDAMVDTLGWTYQNYSKQFLGKLDSFMGFWGRVAKVEARNREIGNFFRLAESSIRAGTAARRMAQAEERRDKANSKKKSESEESARTPSSDGAQPSNTNSAEAATGGSTPASATVESSNVTAGAAAAAATDSGATKRNQKSSKAAAGAPAETPTGHQSGPRVTWKDPTDMSSPPDTSRKDTAPSSSSSSSATEDDQASGSSAPNSDAFSGSQSHPAGPRDEVFKEAIPHILKTMLHVCIADIQSTVRTACKKVLKDQSVPIEHRRQRAEALLEMGGIFREEADAFKANSKDQKQDPFRQMEEAFIRAMAEFQNRAAEEAIKRAEADAQ